jgi:hypothetical protein
MFYSAFKDIQQLLAIIVSVEIKKRTVGGMYDHKRVI